jgi:hypothetical protein
MSRENLNILKDLLTTITANFRMNVSQEKDDDNNGKSIVADISMQKE